MYFEYFHHFGNVGDHHFRYGRCDVVDIIYFGILDQTRYLVDLGSRFREGMLGVELDLIIIFEEEVYVYVLI